MKGEVFLSQGKYTVDVLRRLGMIDYKFMSTPMVYNIKKLNESDSGSDLIDPTIYKQLIVLLMHLIHTIPDICYDVSNLSQFMYEPRHRHWVAAKHVLKYFRGSIAYGLRYASSGGVMLLCYSTSDWGGSIVD